jgi:hypothetical protein
MKNINKFEEFVNENTGPALDSDFTPKDQDDISSINNEPCICEININKDFNGQKEDMLKLIDKFMHEYEIFTTRVSPKNWRQTGSHFTELRKMKADIKDFTEMKTSERNNSWVKDELDQAQAELEDDLKRRRK